MAVGNNISKVYKMTIGGKTFQIDPASQGGYLKAYNEYANDRKAQLNQTQAQLNQTLAENQATTNANYDNSARQAYVDYMRKQKALPGQLQALGVRGGATESGLMNMYSNYGAAHAANEQQRNADLTANINARNDAWNTSYQDYLADMNDQKQQAISNQINEYNNEVTRFSSTVAQYPTTAAGYKAYQKWIENVSASNDPLKDIKVALIRQQMATQFPNGDPEALAAAAAKSSGGGGGGSRRRSGGSRRSSGGSTKSSKKSTKKIAKETVDKTVAVAKSVNDTVSKVNGKKKKKKGKATKLTDAQYQKMYGEPKNTKKKQKAKPGSGGGSSTYKLRNSMTYK